MLIFQTNDRISYITGAAVNGDDVGFPRECFAIKC